MNPTQKKAELEKQLQALDEAGGPDQAREIADESGQKSTPFVISADQRLENLEEKVDAIGEQLGAVLQILQSKST